MIKYTLFFKEINEYMTWPNVTLAKQDEQHELKRRHDLENSIKKVIRDVLIYFLLGAMQLLALHCL